MAKLLNFYYAGKCVNARKLPAQFQSERMLNSLGRFLMVEGASLEKIILITVLTAFFAFGRTLINPILSPYMKGMGFSNFQISLIFSVFSVAVIFLSPVIGKISDDIGRKHVIIAGIFFSAVGFVFYYIAGWFFLVAARVFEAIGLVAVGLIALSKLEDGIGDRHRGSITGFNESVNTIGAMLGPLFGGIMADYFTVKAPFVAAVIVMLLIFIGLLFWKEPHKQALSTSDFNFVKTLRHFLSRKELRTAAMLGFFMHATVPLIYIFVPLLIVEEFKLGYAFVGYFMFAYAFFSLFQFAYGRISDAAGRTTIIILSTIMSGVTLLLFSLSSSYGILFLLTLAMSFANANWSVNMWSYLSSIGERGKYEGEVAGSFYSLAKIGSLFSYLSCSLLALYLDIKFLFIIFGALLVLSALIAKRTLLSGPE